MSLEETEVNTEAAFREKYQARVREVTLEELPEFLNELMDQEHDYGTVCIALGLGAAATAWAMNKHDQGHVTGFQSGFIAWEFLRHWGALYPRECGGRMLDYTDLLYPQYEEKFTSISKETWETVQAEAKKRLAEVAEENAASSVCNHWRSIVEGKVPFGLRVTE